MKLALRALASRFSALALELIDRSFDDRLIGKERFNKFSYLVGEMNERLAESREFLPIGPCLYAHYIISIQIEIKKASKISFFVKKFYAGF